MTGEAIDPLANGEWRDLFERSPHACIFHHPRWLQLLQEQYGYRVYALCVRAANGRLAAGLPLAEVRSHITGKRLVALPFSDICRPLQDSSLEARAGQLVDALAAERNRQGLGIEVRARLPQSEGLRVAVRFVQHTLELSRDPDAIRARFSKSQVKRGIAKARREGVTIEGRTDAAALERFYSMHVRTRRRQGVPTQPKRFIMRFVELFDAGLGFVLLAVDGERDLAAAVFLTAGGTLTYKYGASDPRFLRKRPNNLLFMEAIRWGCENGQRILDFGRTDLDNEGLRRFKSAWGARESELAYSYLGWRPPSDVGRRGERVLRSVIQRSPPVVGRLIGEALYRHFG